MNKKMKYGKVDIPEKDFKDENALVRVAMILPLNLVRELKRLSLTEEYEGKYQVLSREILSDWVTSQQKSKKKEPKIG